MPNKSIQLVAGRPAIAYTIDAARGAGTVDRCVVSTEDARIAEVACSLGAPVVRRPAELSTETARLDGVLQHAVVQVEEQHGFIPHITLAYPTQNEPSPAPLSEGFDFELDNITLAANEVRMTFALLDATPSEETATAQPFYAARTALEKLGRKYKLRNIEPVVKDFKAKRRRMKDLLGKDEAALTKKEKHLLQRLGRAPKGAKVPELGRIYRIKLGPGQSATRGAPVSPGQRGM